MKSKFFYILPAITVFALMFPVSAHNLRVFAARKGPEIHGSAYFGGGGVSKNTKVEIYKRNGEKIGETVTDSEGKFSFKTKYRNEMKIIASNQDGHLAEFKIKGQNRNRKSSTKSTVSREKITASTLDENRFREIVAEEISQQLYPLKQQLDEYENKVRLRDIVGGVGYIFGLAGIVLYFLAVRKAQDSDKKDYESE